MITDTTTKEIYSTHDTPSTFSKHIHLLYVPTIHCNLGCQYCYLGSLTDVKLNPKQEQKCVETLQYTLSKCIESGVLPFNVSLHGGEVTTLQPNTLEQLYGIISNHYLTYMDHLMANNFKKNSPHIKTNLFNFDRLYDQMLKHKVSISASIDLPLSLHDKYRTTKKGRSTLKKTLQNLKLLSQYPHSAKISTTLFQEHFELADEIIEDIWYIHNEIGFDMNQFNFMFGFNSALNDEKMDAHNMSVVDQVNEQQQVSFYEKMKGAFLGTELEYGFRKNWFDEFTPSYCTSSINCGERFYLLQENGDVYSCVRGQGVEPFHYGNVYENSIEEILSSGKSKIQNIHEDHGYHEDCQKCEYLHLCHTGCPFVKHESKSGKSYTCALQKSIYKDNPLTYPAAPAAEDQKAIAKDYQFEVHSHSIQADEIDERIAFRVPLELQEKSNQLNSIIDEDAVLKELYHSDNFKLFINEDQVDLQSQILKTQREIYNLFDDDKVVLCIKKHVFDIESKSALTNTLHLQLLRDTKVVYGDEQRTKQEHIFTYQLYQNQLTEKTIEGEEYLVADLTPLLNVHTPYFKNQILNNLFITTSALRDYHYKKQKENAFYHIQAINLPFQNFEFYWITL